MLVFDLNRALRLRGVEKNYKFLIRIGLSPQTAKTLAKGDALTIKFAHLEKICLALNCTPNDLFDWQPNAVPLVAETHSLNSLKRDETAKDLTKLLKEIPMDKFSEKLESIIDELKTQ